MPPDGHDEASNSFSASYGGYLLHLLSLAHCLFCRFFFYFISVTFVALIQTTYERRFPSAAALLWFVACLVPIIPGI